jgi:hypothetical protein
LRPKAVEPGFAFALPKIDIDGDEIDGNILKLVVAMPSCSGCTSRSLSSEFTDKYKMEEILYVYPNSPAVLLSESDKLSGKLILSHDLLKTPKNFFDMPPRAYEMRQSVLGREVTEISEMESRITRGDVNNAKKK